MQHESNVSEVKFSLEIRELQGLFLPCFFLNQFIFLLLFFATEASSSIKKTFLNVAKLFRNSQQSTR